MFVFPTSGFAGATVTAATFNATLVHSASCTASRVDLYKTASFGSGTTWNNHASTWVYSGAFKTAEACDDVPVSLDFTAATLVTQVNAAANGSATITLGLRANNEAHVGHEGWKKFAPTTAKLSVTFNHKPVKPAGLTSGGAGCLTGSSRPWVSSTKLDAIFDDADNDPVTATFTWWQMNTDGTWPTTATGSANVPSITHDQHGFYTPTLTAGKTYRWQVRSKDTGNLLSDLSAFCEFSYDPLPVAAPSVTPPAGLYDSATTATGDVGVPGTFTLGPAGQPNIVGYNWTLSAVLGGVAVQSGTVSAGTDGTAPLTVTPHAAGENILSVQSRNAAGTVSAAKVHTFSVYGSPPAAWWLANEGADATLYNNPDIAELYALTVTGTGAGTGTWTPVGLGRVLSDQSDFAAVFNGTDNAAQSSVADGLVLDTTGSYAVMAWAKPTVTSGTRTVVSSDAASASAFRVQLAGGQWCMTQDATHKACATAAADAPLAGVWTYLVGVYDKPAGKLRLYVNGVLKAEVASGTPVAATGAWAVGRGQVSGAAAEFFAGEVDEIRAYRRVVYSEQIKAIANELEFGLPHLLGQWSFEDDPVIADDSSATGNNGTLGSGATWTTSVGAPGSTRAVALNGTGTGTVEMGPALRASQSFTISVWAKLASATGYLTVFNQDGLYQSAVYLRYQDSVPGGWWVFSLRTKDHMTDSQQVPAYFGPAPANVWVHLVVVYDAGLQQMRIYADGVLKATTAYRQTWDGTGPFALGRTKYSGTPTGFYPGSVDEVKVYLGVLTDDFLFSL